MTLTHEQQTIIGTSVGVAANNAATIIAGTLAEGFNLDDTKYIVGAYADLVKDFTTVIIAQRGEAAGLLGLTEAFPGSQLQVQQAPAQAAPVPNNVVPMPVQQAAPPAQPPAQPPAVPGASDGDPVVADLWTKFFADPSAWYDNRFNKRNPKGPDFSSKTIPQADNPQYKAGLWINSKQNPSWVPQALQQAGY